MDRASTDLEQVAADADFAILCVPVGAMPELARRLEPLLPSGALVTDVGSVKACVVSAMTPIFGGRVRFVGSHPMAGSERSGMDAARSDLFEGAVCIVTPSAENTESDVGKVSGFWQSIGCSVRLLSAASHDQFVAQISHLPHLLAAALVNSVQEPEAFDFAGPGFRDTTRIASGPPVMWTEILRENKEAVRKTAEALIEKLEEVLTLLDHPSPEGDTLMNDFLTKAKIRRDSLRLSAKRSAVENR